MKRGKVDPESRVDLARSPIAMLVWNRDWEHWQDVMAPEADATPDPQGQAPRGGRLPKRT